MASFVLANSNSIDPQGIETACEEKGGEGVWAESGGQEPAGVNWGLERSRIDVEASIDASIGRRFTINKTRIEKKKK